jgi:acyl dehydratase
MIIGDSAVYEKTFSSEEVSQFYVLSGDVNPVHLDAAYAAETPFKKPIVHGMLYSSMISAILANTLPGPGTIYLGQTLSFLKPVFFEDHLIAKVELIEILPKGIYKFLTTIVNQHSELVVKGEATVKYDGKH